MRITSYGLGGFTARYRLSFFFFEASFLFVPGAVPVALVPFLNPETLSLACVFPSVAAALFRSPFATASAMI